MSPQNLEYRQILRNLSRNTTFATHFPPTNTPFPIPPQHLSLYQWLHEVRSGPPEVKEEAELDIKVENYFTHGFEPQYFEFYKWLYLVRHDKERSDKRNKYWDNYGTPNYLENIDNTPFPVPAHYRKYFALVNHIEDILNTTPFRRHSTPPGPPPPKHRAARKMKLSAVRAPEVEDESISN